MRERDRQTDRQTDRDGSSKQDFYGSILGQHKHFTFSIILKPFYVNFTLFCKFYTSMKNLYYFL